MDVHLHHLIDQVIRRLCNGAALDERSDVVDQDIQSAKVFGCSLDQRIGVGAFGQVR